MPKKIKKQAKKPAWIPKSKASKVRRFVKQSNVDERKAEGYKEIKATTPEEKKMVANGELVLMEK